MGFDWKTAIRGIAPALGGMFGGPLGAAATAALAQAVLGDKATGDTTKDEAGIAAALSGGMTPELRTRILEAENAIKLAAMQYADAEQAREVERLRIELADTQSARTRDAEFIKSGRYNLRADLLALLAVLGLIVCLWFIVNDPSLPERATNAIMFVAGVFASAMRDVFSFEFGSSRGSREKDHALADAAKR